MQLVEAAAAGDDVGDLATFVETREALVVVRVCAEYGVGRAPRASEALIERVSERQVRPVLGVGREHRMVHREDQRYTRARRAKLAGEPAELLLVDLTPLGHAGVETDDRHPIVLERPVHVRLVLGSPAAARGRGLR